MSTELIQPDPKREEESRRAKFGYFIEFGERYPTNTNPANCTSPESAYMLHLEKTSLDIPEHLELGNIIDEIPKEHYERLIDIWLKLIYHQKKLKQRSKLLQEKWENPPSYTPDEAATRIAKESITKIRKKFRAGAIAMISNSEEPELEKWQEEEKGLRENVHHTFKNLTTSIKAYYEMLLETGKKEGEYVLPATKTYANMYRNEVAIGNKHSKIIDTFHGESVGGKGAHHTQTKSRLRKAENKPFVAHEMRTTMAAILDVLPYAPDKAGLITLVITCAIHDTVEDTGLPIDVIMRKYVEQQLNFIDSSLIPFIKPGFEEKYLKKARKIRREQGETPDHKEEENMVPSLFQEDVIYPVGRHRKAIIKQILRIVSNNQSLDDKERKKAYQNNIAGKQILKITKQDLNRWRLVDKDDHPTSKTFTAWPKEYDKGKLAHFLLRLNTITKSKKTRKNALLVKIEDRADNIDTLEDMNMDYQFKTLRSTVTRLVAWCMLDYKEHEEFPLYNALPRLIDVTLQEYERVQAEHPDLMQEFDTEFIEQLTDWKREVIRFEVPAKVKKVLDEYEKAKK